MIRRFRFLVVAAMAILLAGPLSVHGDTLSGIHLEPNLISMGAFYNGARAVISGDIPADSDVLVCVSQEEKDFDFFKKGHVLGLFWMNVGEVTVNHVPGVYMLYLPVTLKASDVDAEAARRNLAIGFAALEKQASVMPDNGDGAKRFQEFIKLKTAKGLYAVHPDAVVYSPAKNAPGMKTFSCELMIPSGVKQGQYRVTTYRMDRNGDVQADIRSLKIQEAGLPAMVSSLAFDHGAIYGILSAIIAIAAGLLMGVLFKGEKGAH